MDIKTPLLIVFEGIDGSGKTTISKMLYEYLKNNNLRVSWLREPSDSKWGKEIRELSKIYDEIPIDKELDLFTKDRKWDVKNNIVPALKRNKIVILDRYYFSSACYQGAKGLETDMILKINEKFAPPPNALFIIDTEIETALDRIKRDRDSTAILFEKKDYLKKVRKNYLNLKEKNTFIINGNSSIKDVFSETLKHFKELFSQ